jgi:hypothetical protein
VKTDGANKPQESDIYRVKIATTVFCFFGSSDNTLVAFPLQKVLLLLVLH